MEKFLGHINFALMEYTFEDGMGWQGQEFAIPEKTFEKAHVFYNKYKNDKKDQ